MKYAFCLYKVNKRPRKKTTKLNAAIKRSIQTLNTMRTSSIRSFLYKWRISCLHACKCECVSARACAVYFYTFRGWRIEIAPYFVCCASQYQIDHEHSDQINVLVDKFISCSIDCNIGCLFFYQNNTAWFSCFVYIFFAFVLVFFVVVYYFCFADELWCDNSRFFVAVKHVP